MLIWSVQELNYWVCSERSKKIDMDEMFEEGKEEEEEDEDEEKTEEDCVLLECSNSQPKLWVSW